MKVETKTKTKVDVEVEVNLLTLRYLVEDAGYTLEEVAHFLPVTTTATTVTTTTVDTVVMSLQQLRRLARFLDMPLTNFFLSPSSLNTMLQLPVKFLRQGIPIRVSPRTHKAKRKARYLRSVINNIMQHENMLPVSVPRYTLKDNPVECAKHMIGSWHTAEPQTNLADPVNHANPKPSSKLLEWLKDKLAELNIYTFELPMPLAEARGFALVEELPYVIVINSKDREKGKVFTLLHEYAHVLLRQQYGCVDMEAVGLVGLVGSEVGYEWVSGKVGVELQSEKWCNTFATTILANVKEGTGRGRSRRQVYQLLQQGQLQRLQKRFGKRFIGMLWKAYKERRITTADLLEVLQIKVEDLPF